MTESVSTTCPPSAGEVFLQRVRATRQRDRVDPEAGPLDLRKVDWASQDLSGLDFSGCDLSEANLGGADLRGCNFTRAKLAGAVFASADLTGSEFLGADLSGANLSECKAERAGFGHANLTAASFFHARLAGATFGEARLRNADFRAAELQGARIRQADLSGANFSSAVLRDVDLKQSAVPGAVFLGADLTGAILRDLRDWGTARWIGADVGGADFRSATLLKRHIADENYLHEFKNQSPMHRFTYYLWWITSDCGRSLARWGLWNLAMIVAFGFIYTLVDVNYGSHPTWLSPWYYSVVTAATLGYGDVLPVSVPAQVAAMTEVCVGFLALGGLVTILSNKLTRRAD